ncbi:Formin-binding protein 1 [Liparis tanakae]|uniref:Formin-binding protein 1 n=1 Tax=Liparis tanakae TaxID=230148 RepID=A0A4Z2E8N8_9TELE|nr:Formin-binding protein 1 [Liparis tanakae]
MTWKEEKEEGAADSTLLDERNLSKKYQPKRNSREEEETKFTFCRAFLASLSELSDYAGQHEVIAENLTSQIIGELSRYLQELKGERKAVRTCTITPSSTHRSLLIITADDLMLHPESHDHSQS